MYEFETKRVALKSEKKGLMSSRRTAAQIPYLYKNNTGLTDNLKYGVDVLSGFSMDNVHVRYNSQSPAQSRAYAYTQETEIHVTSGQERYLPRNNLRNINVNRPVMQFAWDTQKYPKLAIQENEIIAQLNKLGYTGKYNKDLVTSIQLYIKSSKEVVSSDVMVQDLCKEYIEKNNWRPIEIMGYYNILAFKDVDRNGRLNNDGKIRLTSFPIRFKGISLFRNDDREDFESLSTTTADTSKFNAMSDAERQDAIEKAARAQAYVFAQVKGFDRTDLLNYRQQWIHSKQTLTKNAKNEADEAVSPVKPYGSRFNGIATYPNQGTYGKKDIEYKIDLSDIEFVLINKDTAYLGGVAFYEGEGIKLQIFKNGGEVDIMSYIPPDQKRIKKIL